MIHEWKDEYKTLPLYDYILSFDDGLYSQYQALEYLKTIDTPKYFFISTGIVRDTETPPNDKFITCRDAHKKAFDGNYEDYMSWDEIKEIQRTKNCFIGGHGHNHIQLKNIKLRKKLELMSKELVMFDVFKEHDIDIDKFCFPYNYKDDIYMGFLKQKGIKEFYFYERFNIDTLM
jgi:hypothetical protein